VYAASVSVTAARVTLVTAPEVHGHLEREVKEGGRIEVWKRRSEIEGGIGKVWKGRGKGEER
jgi:hypothetical protein